MSMHFERGNEIARLARGATVHSYLAIRAASNVLAMLRGELTRPG